MIEIKPNMYVRTNNGIIKKIEKIIKFEGESYYLNFKNVVVKVVREEDVVESKGKIIKASYSLIDLIHKGDVITFKNDNDVYKVSSIPDKKYGNEYFWLVFEHEGAKELGVEDIRVTKEIMESELKSILTKEQMEANSYKVGE